MLWLDIFIILFFAANVVAIIAIIVFALKIKNGPVARVTEPIGPIISKGKAIAETGKRELMQNKDRWSALSVEVKGLVGAVRPAGGVAGPQVRFSYRDIVTAFSVLGAVRRGVGDLRTKAKPTSNPPGPAKAKHKAPPQRLGTLGLLPDAIRLIRDVRKALR